MRKFLLSFLLIVLCFSVLFTFAVGAASKYDVNNDGKVNIADVTALLSALSGDGEPVDLDGDGKANISDVTHLLRVLSGEISEHEHAFGDWTVTSDPTCTEQGEETRVCACGESETRPVPALGHDYVGVVTKPTCEDGGYTTYTCSRCGDSYTGNETDPLGHDYAKTVTPPTCTEKGYTVYVCSVCGDTFTTAFTAPTGHCFGEPAVLKAATCTEEGLQQRVCSVCGERQTQAIPKTGHTPVVDPAVAPTCTEPGKTEGSHCSVCGAVIEAQQVVPAAGHHFENGVCTVCGEGNYPREELAGLTATFVCKEIKDGKAYVDIYLKATDLPEEYKHLRCWQFAFDCPEGCALSREGNEFYVSGGEAWYFISVKTAQVGISSEADENCGTDAQILAPQGMKIATIVFEVGSSGTVSVSVSRVVNLAFEDDDLNRYEAAEECDAEDFVLAV